MGKLFGIVGVLAIVSVGCAAASPDAVSSAGADTTTTAIESVVEDGTSSPGSTEPSATSQAATGGDANTVTEDTTSTTSASGTGYQGPLASFVGIAVADLSARLGIPVSDITVVSAESMVWPNGALGCPQPDMSYTQVLVDGTLIVLSANGATYNYHSGGSRDPFLCVPSKTVPGQTSTTLTNSAGGSGEDN